MSIILLQKKPLSWAQQLAVNWDHPFFQGASFGYVFVNGIIFCKDGRIYTPVLPSRVPHKYGMQIGATTKTTLFPVSSLENTLNFSVLAVGHNAFNCSITSAGGNNYTNCWFDGSQVNLGTGGFVGPTTRISAAITNGVADDPIAVSFNGAVTQSSWSIYTKGRNPAITTSGSGASFGYGSGLSYYSGWETSSQTNKAERSVLWAKSGKNCPPGLLASLSENPWQIFKSTKRLVFVPATSGSTHSTTGALGNSGATLSGSATNFTPHPTSGTLINLGASIAGTAKNFTLHATNGVLANTGATLSGVALNFTSHATSGFLTNAGATLSGTALNFTSHTTSGALANTGAVLAGEALNFTSHTTSGALSSSGALVTGDASRSVYGTHTTSGSLSSSGALVTGTALNFTTHVTFGALSNTGALVTGTALKLTTHATSGVLSNTGALVAGTALKLTTHATSGVLSNTGAAISGTAVLGDLAPLSIEDFERVIYAWPETQVITEMPGSLVCLTR